MAAGRHELTGTAVGSMSAAAAAITAAMDGLTAGKPPTYTIGSSLSESVSLPATIGGSESAFSVPIASSSSSFAVLTETGSQSLVQLLTIQLVETYKRCNPAFTYLEACKPKRPLTKPSVGVGNGGFDNEAADLILYVNSALAAENGRRYIVKGMLGQGTFGQVASCVREDTREIVAVKVIKNQPAYYHQARVEVGVLQMLNNYCDVEDKHHIVRLLDHFMHCNHLCLVFELLTVNLYELIKQNHFRGLSMNLVRVFIKQILDALVVLREARVVHCDLKPENILLKSLESGEIKLIDFGSACFENRTVYSYIQSRFYRSPEVLLGHPYTTSIDMWSLGCVSAELFLGLPLFPGASEYDLLMRIVETLGKQPPDEMIMKATSASRFFARVKSHTGSDGTGKSGSSFRMLTIAEHEARAQQKAPTGKRYFKHTQLSDIIVNYAYKKGLTTQEIAHERSLREAFVDFLTGVLDMDPKLRWTPRQAQTHPFVLGKPFKGGFTPPPEPIRPPVMPVPQLSPRGPQLWSSPGYGTPQAGIAMSPQYPITMQHSPYGSASTSMYFTPPSSLQYGLAYGLESAHTQGQSPDTHRAVPAAGFPAMDQSPVQQVTASPSSGPTAFMLGASQLGYYPAQHAATALETGLPVNQIRNSDTTRQYGWFQQQQLLIQQQQQQQQLLLLQQQQQQQQQQQRQQFQMWRKEEAQPARSTSFSLGDPSPMSSRRYQRSVSFHGPAPPPAPLLSRRPPASNLAANSIPMVPASRMSLSGSMASGYGSLGGHSYDSWAPASSSLHSAGDGAMQASTSWGSSHHAAGTPMRTSFDAVPATTAVHPPCSRDGNSSASAASDEEAEPVTPSTSPPPPDPHDWNPLYSDEALLVDDSSKEAAPPNTTGNYNWSAVGMSGASQAPFEGHRALTQHDTAWFRSGAQPAHNASLSSTFPMQSGQPLPPQTHGCYPHADEPQIMQPTQIYRQYLPSHQQQQQGGSPHAFATNNVWVGSLPQESPGSDFHGSFDPVSAEQRQRYWLEQAGYAGSFGGLGGRRPPGPGRHEQHRVT